MIAFDRINLDAIAARYPTLRQRIHLLGEAAPTPGVDAQIRDPEGRDEATFLSTYRRIDDCLAVLAQAASAPLLQKSPPC